MMAAPPPDYQALTNALGNIQAAVNSVQNLPAEIAIVQQELSRLANQPSNQNLAVMIQQLRQMFTRRFNALETELRAR
jgi:hypothetical protein